MAFIVVYWLKRKLQWLNKVLATRSKLEQLRAAVWMITISDLILYCVKSSVVIYLTHALIYLEFNDLAQRLIVPWLLVFLIKTLMVYFILLSTWKRKGRDPIQSLQSFRIAMLGAVFCLFAETFVLYLNFGKWIWIAGTVYAVFVGGNFIGVAHYFIQHELTQLFSQLPELNLRPKNSSRKGAVTDIIISY